jgi:WD40 repeat protein
MGRMVRILPGIMLVVICLAGIPAQAQFYNGLNMSFGKNRIQYPKSEVLESEFFASFYRYDRYDVYFYPNGKELAEYVSRYAYRELTKLENFFEYSLNKRVIFLVYNRLSDYRQSNIGLVSGKDETNIGGVTRVIDNKVFLYFEGDYRKFEQQILAAITEVIMQEMLYGGSMRDRLASSTLLNMPEWYYKGLVAFLSKGWDVETENRVKDGILSGRFEKFNRLEGQDAVDAGHSMWNFISETFGKSVIPTIVYFTRINRNTSSGFLNVLGTNIKALSYEWLHFYKSRYAETAHQGDIPESPLVKLKNKKGTEYLRARMSPDGRYIAYTSNSEGQIRVWLYDVQTNKSKRIYKTGAKLGQIEDYTFPALAWHPTSGLLAMIMEFKGNIRYSLYPMETRKWEHQQIKQFDKVLDFSYSDDGLNLVLSGVMKGQSDIFVYNLVANTSERITNDRADDFSPKFIDNSTRIIFTSNRKDLSLEDQTEDQQHRQNLDVYIFNYANRDDRLTRLSEDDYVDRFQPDRLDDQKFYFLGDDNGLRNRYVAEFDSTIISIDTTINYSFNTRSAPLTNYGRNILDQSFSKSTREWSSLFFTNGKYRLARGSLDQSLTDQPVLPKTSFRSRYTRDLARQDSAKAAATVSAAAAAAAPPAQFRPLTLTNDTLSKKSGININNYVFDAERNAPAAAPRIQKPLSAGLKDPVTGRTFDVPPLRIYQPSFYINYLASQVDFTFLNSSYQTFTGGAVYYNPGLNMLFKVGTQDLFEDYKLIGGVRFGANFESNEYLLSFENLKKRLDKEIIFHRQVYQTPTQDYYSIVKATTQELFYLLKYPFSQVNAVKATINGRIDNYNFLSTDQANMIEKGITKYWAGFKLEYIFDNTRMITLNLYEGMRYKVFGEYYQQVNGDWSDVFIVGADFRHYQPIHRTLIWANRFAASTSFGGSRLIYYLGGVDNWTNLSRTLQTFDRSMPIDTTQNFVYQTIATNMRGFSQNIRNGNSFAVFNSELRWPVFRYFANKPINSDFLNNFQLIGFFDIGTAWSGQTPWDEKNHLNREVIKNGPLVIVINKGNEPIVMGYGFGVRSRLLGYFLRADWAWGIENHVVLPRVFYLSLSLDF